MATVLKKATIALSIHIFQHLKCSFKESSEKSEQKALKMLNGQHRCRFPSAYDGSVIDHHLPNSPWWKKTRRFIRKLIVVSPLHHQTHRFFKSNSAIKRESERQVKNYIFFTIHPFSLFRMYWNLIVYFSLGSKMLVAPFAVAFSKDIGTIEWRWLRCFSMSITSVLYLEIFFKFFTGYIDKQVMQITLDKWKIFKQYTRSWFLLDLIGSAPFIIFVSYTNPPNWTTDSENLATLADDRNWRLFWQFLSILYLCNIFRYSQFTNYFSGIPAMLNLTEKTTIYTQLSIAIAMVLHWGACLRLYIPFLVAQFQKPFHHFLALYHAASLDMIIAKSSAPLAGSNYNFTCDDVAGDARHFSIFERYMRSLSIVVRLSMTTGFGAETADCIVEMIMTSIITIVGWTFFAVITMTILRLITSLEVAECQYEATYNEIEVYCKAKHISKHLKDKIITYYTHKYQQNYFNERAIIKTLSNRLKREILMHTCQPLVTKVQLFDNLPKPLLQEIMKCLVLEIFLAYDIVLHEGTYGDSMFFIASGTAAVYGADGREICHLTDGDHFGEISLLVKGQKRTATVIAIETCEIYRLSRQDFDRVVQPHTNLYERMQRVAYERLGSDRNQRQRRQSIRILESFIN